MPDLQDQPSHLCSRCSTLPLDAFFDIIPKAIELELGLFYDIVAKSEDCSFCQLVVQAFYVHLDPHWQPGEYPNQMCYLLVDEQKAASSSSLINVYCDITSESMPGGIFGSYKLLGFIGLPLQDGTNDSTQNLTTRELSYDLISSWVEECRLHDKCNVGISPYFEGNTGIWLVDVQDMCLVHQPWNCRYVALSYVWGSLITFRSQKANFHSLQLPASLNGFMGEIPQVIQDAIVFTAKIKQRYLWVDSLCIVQDDDAFKERYIPRMHLIYQSAVATIIATTGKDANKGLPGVSYPREKPNTPIKIGARLLEAKSPALLPLMWNSKWKTRAWTFQEAVFSRNRIYLTDYQVYWVCSSRRASESGTAYSHRNVRLWDNSSTSLLSRSVDMSRRDFYESLVKEVSNRNLSYHSDSLSAFAGLLSKMGEMYGWSFVSAIPESNFESFLSGGCLSAVCFDQEKERSMTRMSSSAARLPVVGRRGTGKAVTTKSEVGGYWISERTGFKKIGEPGSPNGQILASSPSEKQPNMPDSDHLEIDVPPNTLMFKAHGIVAKPFEIKLPNFDPACSRYFRGNLTRAGWVYDSNGRHCGTLRGINFSKYHDQEKWEIILLSRSDQDEVLQANIDATPSTDLPPEYPSAKEYYEEIFDTTAYKYRRWWALNIMLVERKGMWVERVAVGQIHADAWESALGQSSPETIFLA
ncbi:hypothetical protein GCG54_00000630 [Colletotrichum gloeosporioides]|uniref:Heterokaryon incompatibility domain-containing protein n=1 Tax=Colletotrichum gloeosporioides TaxID=474922 RepID=A0A8H4CI67_COLGL|nr:uncharacterized protein GCG54_00000630 [Colletotrichum gloeosporioides]KAF3804279.1 hypothetical protein GCG54_00000630 [Colletotrichum gloeosporioides]